MIDKGWKMAVSRKVRFEVLTRDHGKPCLQCGEKEGPFEVDHRIPVSAGGTDDLENLQKLCRVCNGGKSDMVLDPETNLLTKPVHVQTTEEVARSKTILQAKIIQALFKAEPISFKVESVGSWSRPKLVIGSYGGATRKEFITDHGISAYGLDEALRTLKEKGWISRFRSPERGRWFIVFDVMTRGLQKSPYRDEWYETDLQFEGIDTRELPDFVRPSTDTFIRLDDFRSYARSIGVDLADADTRLWEKDYIVFREDPRFLEDVTTGSTTPNRNICYWSQHPTSEDHEWYPYTNSVRDRASAYGHSNIPGYRVHRATGAVVVNPHCDQWLEHPDDVRCQWHPPSGKVRFRPFSVGDICLDEIGQKWRCYYAGEEPHFEPCDEPDSGKRVSRGCKIRSSIAYPLGWSLISRGQ